VGPAGPSPRVGVPPISLGPAEGRKFFFGFLFLVGNFFFDPYSLGLPGSPPRRGVPPTPPGWVPAGPPQGLKKKPAPKPECGSGTQEVMCVDRNPTQPHSPGGSVGGWGGVGYLVILSSCSDPQLTHAFPFFYIVKYGPWNLSVSCAKKPGGARVDKTFFLFLRWTDGRRTMSRFLPTKASRAVAGQSRPPRPDKQHP